MGLFRSGVVLMSGILQAALATVASPTSPPPPPPPPSFDANVSWPGETTSVASASGSANGPGSNPIGGTPPYSYSWTRTGSSKISLSSLTTQNPQLVWSGLIVGDYVTGSFEVIVRDANGLTAKGSALYDITRTS